MKVNVGPVDRVTRVVVGLVLLSLLFTIEGPWRWIGLVSVIPLGTALIGWCPLYSLFGISSCPLDRRAHHV